MIFRVLGNTGMPVSVLSYGFWASHGDKTDASTEDAVEVAMKCMRVAREGGVNFFDNAEGYGRAPGDAEIVFGKALKRLQDEDPHLWRRSDLMVSTKIFFGGGGAKFGGQNEFGLSRKHVMEGLDASLKRMNLEYVDIVFCHRFDPLTGTESIVRHMTDTVRSGRAMSWGTSEWSAQRITEAYWIAKQGGLEPPMAEQPQFNLFHRDRVENEYAALYQQPYNIGTTIWSPLASGLLTGKYDEGVPKGSRLDQKRYAWLQKTLKKWGKDGSLEKAKRLEKLAQQQLKCSLAQLAIAWCVKKGATTVLLGASKLEQIQHNFEALDVFEQLTADHMESIEKILMNKPPKHEPIMRPPLSHL